MNDLIDKIERWLKRLLLLISLYKLMRAIYKRNAKPSR